jgi:hypothetical protein
MYTSMWRPTNAGWPIKIFLHISFYANFQANVTANSRYQCLSMFDSQQSIQVYLPIKSSLDLSLSQIVTSNSWDWSS